MAVQLSRLGGRTMDEVSTSGRIPGLPALSGMPIQKTPGLQKDFKFGCAASAAVIKGGSAAAGVVRQIGRRIR